jgi:hypothetical protein
MLFLCLPVGYVQGLKVVADNPKYPILIVERIEIDVGISTYELKLLCI